jgi:hypothetical protein
MTDVATDSSAALKKHAEDTKKRLADEKAAREKATKDAVPSKPTPTQEENDLAVSGVHVMEHEEDGSPPDPMGVDPLKNKQSEAKPAAARGGYATRATETK